MDRDEISDGEKQGFIELMLRNEGLEEAARKWNGDSCMYAALGVLDALAARAQQYGGLIVSVRCREIPAGADNIEFFMADKYCEVCWVEDADGKRYAMVFTSRERFGECGDTSGVVMFMDDLLAMAEAKEELDGIVINLGSEQVVIDKPMLRIAMRLLEIRKGTDKEPSHEDMEGMEP